MIDATLNSITEQEEIDNPDEVTDPGVDVTTTVSTSDDGLLGTMSYASADGSSDGSGDDDIFTTVGERNRGGSSSPKPNYAFHHAPSAILVFMLMITTLTLVSY